VALLRLSNGVTNAIGPELVAELSAALDEVKERFRGMVLAGGDKFFSIGLDLPALIKLGPKEMTEFWTQFEEMILDLFCLPIPTAAAISGHAPAAGTILALACDFRFLATGKKLMGLNEIQLGLPVPFLADLILRQTVGDRAATEIEYTGELLAPEKAKALALVDGLFSETEVETQAIVKVALLVEGPRFGFPLSKQHRTRDIRSRFLSARQGINQAFIECWFAAGVRKLLSAASEKF
jgi:enoyl-CoA hydratase/carnithine racemase